MAVFILSIFALEALLLVVLGVLAVREHVALSRYVAPLCVAAALICVLMPNSLWAPNARFLAVISLLMFLSIDAMLISLYAFSRAITGFDRNLCIVMNAFVIAGFIVDGLLFATNLFIPVMSSYVPSTWSGGFAWKYVHGPLFPVHMVYDYILVSFSIVLLLVKAIKTPRIYRMRYLILVFTFLTICLLNVLFVYGPVTMPFDYSSLLYPIAVVVIFWDAFRYAREILADRVMREVTHSIDLPIAVFDSESDLVSFNESLGQLFPDCDIIMGMSLECFAAQTQMPSLREADESLQFTWSDPQNRNRVFRCVYSLPQDSKTGLVIGRALIMHDVSDMRDEVTGLANEQGFLTCRLELEQIKEPIVVVACVKVDHLNTLNERYSREEGDHSLHDFAEQLTAFFPKRALIANRGSADIALLVPGMSEEQVVDIFKRMKQEMVWDVPDDIFPEFQYGVVEVRDGSISLREATRKASSILSLKRFLSMSSSHSALIAALSRVLIDRGISTEGHMTEMKHLAQRLCAQLELSEFETIKTILLMTLRDIGKLSIPDSVVFKSGMYTHGERRLMETHAEIGYRIMHSSRELSPLADGILHHHECWNGTGYPDGLIGDEIPIEARVAAVLDSYDAMTHERSYRPMMTRQQAIEELINCSGSQFDPSVVSAFLRLLEEPESCQEAIVQVVSERREFTRQALEEIERDESGSQIVFDPQDAERSRRLALKLADATLRNDLLQQQVDSLMFSNGQAVSILSQIMGYREAGSQEHVERIVDHTYLIASEIARKYPSFGITEEQAKLMAKAAALHDVGKITVPDTILLKAANLDEAEFAIMKTHTICGAEILERALRGQADDFARFAIEIARSHHERWDGTGYPDGLAGSEIPLSAQIVALVDAYDELISEHLHKKGASASEALEMVMEGRCGRFSPRLLAIFARVAKEFDNLYPAGGFQRRKLVSEGYMLLGEQGALSGSDSAKRSVERIVNLLIDTNRDLVRKNHYDLSTKTFGRNYYIEYLHSFNPAQHDSVGVTYFDVNELHEYNRDHGHAQGDAMLVKVADVLLSTFPSSKVFRTGGDEFVAISEDVSEADLRKAINRAITKLEDQRLSVSIGYDWRDSDLDMDEIVKTADQQMFLHKGQYYSGKGKQPRRM